MVEISWLVLDVDGVLTDGRLSPSPAEVPQSTEFAASGFHAQDGYSIKLWQKLAGRVAVISGRPSRWAEARARELGVEPCLTGVTDKGKCYFDMLARFDCSTKNVCYVGDDLPDIVPLQNCAWAVAVSNAVPAVKKICDYVTRRPGGHGVVAEVVEYLLRRQRRWAQALKVAHG